jgi:hypothetical protein
MAAKKPARRKPARGDSPINIGGGGGIGKILGRRGLAAGSLYIYFDNNWYTPKPGDAEQHWNKNDEIGLLTVIEGAGSTPHPEADPTRTIKIHCNAANGHDSPITIKGKSLGVKFKLRDYDYDSTIGMYVSTVPRMIGVIEVSGKPDIFHAPGCLIAVDDKVRHRPWKQIKPGRR